MLCITPPLELIAQDEFNSFYGAEHPTARTPTQFLHVFQPTNGPFEGAITARLRAHQEYIVRTHCNWPLK